jgi:hypothetical protein
MEIEEASTKQTKKNICMHVYMQDLLFFISGLISLLLAFVLVECILRTYAKVFPERYSSKLVRVADY